MCIYTIIYIYNYCTYVCVQYEDLQLGAKPAIRVQTDFGHRQTGGPPKGSPGRIATHCYCFPISFPKNRCLKITKYMITNDKYVYICIDTYVIYIYIQWCMQSKNAWQRIMNNETNTHTRVYVLYIYANNIIYIISYIMLYYIIWYYTILYYIIWYYTILNNITYIMYIKCIYIYMCVCSLVWEEPPWPCEKLSFCIFWDWSSSKKIFFCARSWWQKALATSGNPPGKPRKMICKWWLFHIELLVCRRVPNRFQSTAFNRLWCDLYMCARMHFRKLILLCSIPPTQVFSNKTLES
jgi:hypothetical protein